MISVEICVGSSCCIKGSEEIIRLFHEALEREQLTKEVDLVGCLCLGACNRTGVNLRIDGTLVTGITPESFSDFFRTYVLQPLKGGSTS